jgi:hypothetical protein
MKLRLKVGSFRVSLTVNALSVDFGFESTLIRPGSAQTHGSYWQTRNRAACFPIKPTLFYRLYSSNQLGGLSFSIKTHTSLN